MATIFKSRHVIYVGACVGVSVCVCLSALFSCCCLLFVQNGKFSKRRYIPTRHMLIMTVGVLGCVCVCVSACVRMPSDVLKRVVA